MHPKHEKTRKVRLLRPFFFVSLAIAAVSFLLHLLCVKNVSLANFFTQYVTAPVRSALAYVFAVFPFSLAELLLLLSPLWLVLLIRYARRVAGNRLRAGRFLSALLAVPLLIYSVFVFTFAPGYYTTSIDERLALSEEEPDADNLFSLVTLLAENAEREAALAGVSVSEEGSILPLSREELNLSLIRSYEKLSAQHGFLSGPAVGVKFIALSEPMAYTNITGVYTFFTGESNVCTDYPDFTLVYTAAHEMAHARGIAREDEANFVAFLACEASDDPYIRYAGYMNLLQYVSNALYRTDFLRWQEAAHTLSPTVLRELIAYDRYYESHSDTVVSDIVESVNDAYLSGMGTEGTVSYNLVVRLAVKYLS